MGKLRVGMLTSGGDCPGLNATIRGAAKAIYEAFGEDKVEIVGIHDGYHGLIHGVYKVMQPSDFSGILTQGGTILGTKRTPFKMMQIIEDDKVDKVKEMKDTYKDLKLDCLFTLGGNGTHKTANMLSEDDFLSFTICVSEDATKYLGDATMMICVVLENDEIIVVKDNPSLDLTEIENKIQEIIETSDKSSVSKQLGDILQELKGN